MKNKFYILFFLIISGCISLKSVQGDIRGKIVRIAKNLLEKKYSYGKQDLYYGFDCSGFVQFVYAQAGLKIKRTAVEQYKDSKKVSLEDLQPGDLVFFIISSKVPDHVGIYIGNKYFIHSPSSGKKIKISSFDNYYWRKKFYIGGTYL